MSMTNIIYMEIEKKIVLDLVYDNEINTLYNYTYYSCFLDFIENNRFSIEEHNHRL